jgi:uncharacterized OB-fold protein
MTDDELWSKPTPVPDDLTRPFWEGARRHELVLQRCTACGTYIHPPRVACRVCQNLEFAPEVVEPRGVVYSYTVSHVPFVPGFEREPPFTLVLVDLDAQPGTRLPTALRDCPPEEVTVGMPVDLVFLDVTDTLTLPYAVPAGRPPSAAS